MSVEEKRPLPEGWEWTKIGEAAKVNYRDRALREMPDEIEVTFVPMAAVDEIDGKIVDPQIRTLGKTRKGYTPFSEGDVLFAKITPCMENGKATIARNLKNGLGFGSTEFHVMKPGDKILAEWLFYFVRQSGFRGEAKANFSGTAGQLRVKKGFIEDHLLPLAPLSEQKRIVAEIEKQFTRLDQAVASLKRAQANLQRYKASVLKAACEGRLVPQDPNDEPAEKLLQRILAERRRKWEEQEWQKLVIKAQKKVAQTRRKAASRPARLSDLQPEEWQNLPEADYARYLPKNDKWKEKYKEPVGVETAELPQLPEGWVWAKLDLVAKKITDGEHFRPTTIDNGIPFLSAKDVREYGVSFTNPLYVSQTDAVKFRKRCDPELQDLLIVSRGATIGRSCIVQTEELFCLLGSVILIKPVGSIDSRFMLYAIRSPKIHKQLANLSGSTAQQAIYIRDIRNSLIPIPPLSEQNRIVSETERRLSVIAANEKAIAADLARAERLRQSILQQAFSGQLVRPQRSRKTSEV